MARMFWSSRPDNYTEERINKAFDLVNDERGFVNEGFEAYRKQVLGMYTPRDAQVNFEHCRPPGLYRLRRCRDRCRL